MRVLLNGVPTLRQPTGVGQYGLQLLRGLKAIQASAKLDAVGVFDGNHVIPLEQLLMPRVPSSSTSARSRVGRVLRGLRPMIPKARMLLERWRGFRLQQSVVKSEWTLYHETNYVPAQFVLPLVTTVCDMGFMRYPRFMPKDRVAWLRQGLFKTLEHARAVIVISEFTRRELLELCPQVDPARVFVTPLGVDTEHFADPIHATRAEEMRQRLGLPKNYVLYLGTLEPRKNVQGVIEAYCQLPLELQREYPLVLAGMAGWQQQYFKNRLETLQRRGVLYHLGYVAQADVAPLLTAASVFCFPSLYEGFGMPVLEAAACGTPVLCSNTSSLPEVMGDAAEYVDPSSAESIATGLKLLLTDGSRREHLRIAGRQRAARFTWEQCALDTVAAYRAAA